MARRTLSLSIERLGTLLFVISVLTSGLLALKDYKDNISLHGVDIYQTLVGAAHVYSKELLTYIALTIGVAAFILVSFGLVIAGPTMADKVAAWFHLGPAFAWTWKILQWPLVFVLASIGTALIYYFAPDVDQQWIWQMPGSLLATMLWLAASLAFKYYVVNISSYAATYGIIGSVMVLMLWFYISGAAILVGAEMNAEIEHASTRGKQPGEKVPGQRRIISAAAMREWIRKRRRRGEKPPSAEEVKAAAEKKPGGAETMEVVADPTAEQEPPHARAS